MRRSNVPLLMAILVEAMGYGAIFGLLAHLQDTYHFPDWGLSLIASSAFPAALIGQLGLARFADRGHTRKLLWIGLATAAMGMVWFFLGTALWEFVIARALVGLGSGTFIPAARRVIISRAPGSAGEAVAAAGAADIGGFLLGIPVAAGLKALADSASLGFVHPVNWPFGALCILLLIVGPIAASVPEPPVHHDAHPEALRAVFRLPAARSGLAIGVGFSVAIGTLDAIASRFIIDLGASDGELVGVMVALAVPLVLFMPVAGRLVDRIGPLKAGAAALLATVPLFIGYGLTRHLWLVAILGAGQALANSVVYTAGQAAVANSTHRAGLVAAGQGAYEATAAVGGFVCSFSAPLLYHRPGHHHGPLLMWSTMALLVAIAATVSRAWARSAPADADRPDTHHPVPGTQTAAANDR